MMTPSCDRFQTMRPAELHAGVPRRAFSYLVVAALLVSVVGCAAIDPQHVLTRRIGNEASADGTAMDAATRQKAYDFVWDRIQEAYVDPNHNGVNWKQVGQEHQPRILAATNDEVFWKNLDTMVAELGDAHARVLSPQQYAFDKEKQANMLGLWLAEFDGEVIVTSVAKDSAGEKAGISKGNRLLKIDGTSALDWWQTQRSKARKNSTERARLKTVKRVFNSGDPEAPTDTVQLEVERNDGSTFEATLTRSVLARKDTLTSTLRPDGFGYMRLTGFDPKLSREILPTFAQIKNAKGLIIDLRGNAGGSLALAVSLMNQLVSGSVPIGKRTTRTGKPPAFLFGLLSIGKLEMELVGVNEPYLGPVMVVVDGDSASASELFTTSLQGIGRVKVVGETTCGCLLGYMGYANVPGGGALAYSEMDFVPIRGNRVEGTGVLPDHKVTPNRQDLKDGKDRALELAISLLNDGAKAYAADVITTLL